MTASNGSPTPWSPVYLPGRHPRARLMRLDAATLLKRFYLCERSVVMSQAAYGRRWHQTYPKRVSDIETLRQKCDALVAAEIARATAEERVEIRRVVEAMIYRAEQNSGGVRLKGETI